MIHTRGSTYLKWTSSTTVRSRTFSSSHTSHPSASSPATCSASFPGTDGHSPTVCPALCWAVPVRGLMKHVALCDWFISLTQCFPDLSVLLNNVLLYSYTTFYSPIQQLIDTRVTSIFLNSPTFHPLPFIYFTYTLSHLLQFFLISFTPTSSH